MIPTENDVEYRGKVQAKVVRGLPGTTDQMRVLSSAGADAVLQLVLYIEHAMPADEFTRRDLEKAIAIVRREIG